MKIKTKLIILAFLVCLAPASAFALVDLNLYGGYTVGGKWSDYDHKYGTDFRYGGAVHLNSGFLAILKLGIGGYYQMSSVTYGDDNGIPVGIGTGDEFTLDKTEFGIDAYAALDIPLIPISPYVKGGTAAWNKVE
ncbi:MAG: hypothetical protein LBT84_04540, partial [Spirochaetia bacterium]|nr:hypothetical protein [Spirochaetia bacterium]